jgi:hypothetical protein
VNYCLAWLSDSTRSLVLGRRDLETCHVSLPSVPVSPCQLRLSAHARIRATELSHWHTEGSYGHADTLACSKRWLSTTIAISSSGWFLYHWQVLLDERALSTGQCRLAALAFFYSGQPESSERAQGLKARIGQDGTLS